ncbi:MAG: hypothetical protein IJ387_04945, partial [Thermoguttaceae bacterium]|nr:hypothetical protein [Thermoguttaceae bacterium]
YSAWVYPLRDSPDGKPYRVSEIASTGLEALLTDPEAFARSSPEQFNRVIQAFEDFRKARSKNVDKPNKAPRSDDAKAQTTKTDAPRSVVEERREPLFKGDARFGDRDAFAKFLSESTKKERKETLGKDLAFAYHSKQLNDDELFDALEQGKTAAELQRDGVYIEHDAFPVKNPKSPTPEEIAANRKREEDEHVRPLLAFWGRTLGPEGPREKNVVLPDNFKEDEKFTGAPNSSAEYYQEGKVKYRLYYDAEGCLEYVDDYSHGNIENHGGPHRHVFFGRAHCFAIDIKEIQ